MIDLDKWQEIYNTLSKNKLRTFLTAFGVFWGIFMLIIMFASGRGLENGVLEGFGDFATNSAFVWSRRTTVPYKGFPRNRWWNFDNDDMIALKKYIPEIDVLAPRVQGWGNDGNNNVTYKEKTAAFNIKGDYPEFFIIDPYIALKGRLINYIDIIEKRKIAIIGTRVREELFEPNEEPIGKYMKIQGVYFQVVGVFEPKSTGINFGGDKLESIHLPFTTLQKTYNFGDNVHYFAFTAKSDVPVSIIEEKCIDLLGRRNNIAPEDEKAFGHFNLEKEFSKMKGLFAGINGLIWIVGIGTLLAGVIGVSNIMLIIVKERTSEIGVKRAIGATPIKIIGQIITESVFLTSIAGAAGLMAGVGAVIFISNKLAESASDSQMFKNPEVDFKIAIVALIILVLAGVVAGLIPAKRAVSIKPIDALRYE